MEVWAYVGNLSFSLRFTIDYSKKYFYCAAFLPIDSDRGMSKNIWG